MQKKLLVMIIFINCVTILSAQDYEDIQYKITSFIIENINFTPYGTLLYEHENNEIKNFFIGVLNNRNSYSENEKYSLRMKIFTLLDKNLIFSYADTPDWFNMTLRRTLCYMTLAMLLPEKTENNHFISMATTSVNGLIDYGYSEQYIIINLLDILLTIDIKYPNYPIKNIIIKKLTELNTYLYENIKNIDDKAIEFIDSIIVEITKEETKNYGLEFIQEDYERDDLLSIMGFGPEDGPSHVMWKISSEELQKQKELTLKELINNIDIKKLITNSDYFINNAFMGLYTNKVYFHSIEYITINNEKYGENKNIKRNDWIILLSYTGFESDFNEIICVLPNYKIIISSTDYEEHKRIKYFTKVKRYE